MVNIGGEATCLNFRRWFERDQCLITDSNLIISDATRTAEHFRHILYGASLQVSLFEGLEDEIRDESEENMDENDITIMVSGILSSTSEDALICYFENSRRSGGGEVSNIDSTEDGETIITFLEVKGTSGIASSFFFHEEVHIYVVYHALSNCRD